MTSIWKNALVLALLAITACARDSASETADSGNVGSRANSTAAAPVQAPNASSETRNTAGGGQPTGAANTGSILAWSRPAAGSTASAPVDELVLHFTPPARLGEVTITGPDGAMPMMVTAVGEVEHYSLPLSADAPGAYTVAWRATAKGREFQGRFGFTLR